MSQPNNPDKTPPAPSDGPAADGPSASASPSRPGGLVPPWQRGPGGANRPESTGGAQAPLPGDNSATAPIAREGRASGPPPRGIVTGSGTAGVGMSGQQAPVKKLDAPAPGQPAGSQQGPGPSTATAEAPRGRFAEVPTRNITRDPSIDESLPDLDEIHHTTTESPRGTASESKGGASRPAPTQIAGSGRALRAAVQIRRLDPWATFKVAGVLAIVGFVIWMIAVAVLYLVLDGMGVWEQVNSSFGTLVTADGSTSGGDIIGAGSVFLYAGLLGVVNAVLFTALATIGSYIYNLVADLVGGVEVTLADLD